MPDKCKNKDHNYRVVRDYIYHASIGYERELLSKIGSILDYHEIKTVCTKCGHGFIHRKPLL